MSANESQKQLSQKELEDLVIENDTGARRPDSKFQTGLLTWTAICWALFQLWIASPLMFIVGQWQIGGFRLSGLVFDDTRARSIHLGFAIILAFLAYPASRRSPRNYIPFLDWIFAVAGCFCALYLYLFYDDLAARSGLPTQFDIIAACIGMLLLLEATRRSLGPPLLIVATVFLCYTFFGSMDWVPDVIKTKSQSLPKVASHQWLTTEGVYGIALGVSTSFVFLFVLFGALLERAGAGNYFIKVAFSLLGHLRGGPAKAAVLSSGLTGLISGSSIANTVTTGTFTIPLMKRVGFSGEKAGAVEVASSVNGQIMPPVMGAAAFLMVEYVGIPYVEVIKHAFIPAIISYIALLYIVHLEALKANMQPIPKRITVTLKQRLIAWGIIISSTVIFSYMAYHVISWLSGILGDSAVYVFSVLLVVAYVGLMWFGSHYPELEQDDPNAPVVELPETRPTVLAGLHYLLPVVVLVWCLMVEQLSPGLSAFWATILMIVMIVTQPMLRNFFRRSGAYSGALKVGFEDLKAGLIAGSRNMIGIGVATAAAGIIVGTVSLTGIGQVLTDLVEVIAGDSIIAVLLLTALICLVLGMGLPTTANYIVVASLMANVVVTLGAQNGLVVPLIAVHLFVFYFGIMADVTPPVGLASFAAAAISGSDPIKTGLQAFAYSIRTAILPFFFIFNTDMLLIGVKSWWEGAFIFVEATAAILLFSAAMQGYFLVRSKLWESAALLFVAVSIFAPQLWIDLAQPPYKDTKVSNLMAVLEEAKKDDLIRVRFEDPSGESELRTFIPITNDSHDAMAILEEFGLVLEPHGKSFIVSDVLFNSAAEKAGIDFDYVVSRVRVPREQMNKRLVLAPAAVLFLVVFGAQLSRRRSRAALATIS